MSLIVRALKHLKQLNRDIFSCFLQADYPDNIYLYERRLHVQKYRFLRSMEGLSSTKDLQQLFNIILDSASLRYRVTDHSIFLVCHQELTAILNEMDKLFARAMRHVSGKKCSIDLEKLSEKIARFEENFQHILQVSAKEPLVFLLYLASLKAFGDEMMTLCSKS